MLRELKDFKFQITLKVTFCKEIGSDETKYLPQIYFSSKTQTMVNDLDINDSLNTSHQIVLAKIQKMFGESSCRIIESVDGDYVTVSLYNLQAGSSYTQLSEELKCSMKCLINLKNKKASVGIIWNT